MKRTVFTRILTAALVLLTLCTIFTTTAFGAEWRTGRFDNGHTAKGFTVVRLNDLRKNGYIRICTYDQCGYKSGGKIHVTLRNAAGRWICEFDTTSGAKLKLGNNYNTYRVYIARKTYPNTVIGNGDDFINSGKCVFWSIQAVSNCYM